MTDWTNERPHTRPARVFDESPCPNVVREDAIRQLALRLRRALVEGAGSGVVIDLVGQVYLRGSWGPQTVAWADFLENEHLQMVGLSQNARVPFVRGLYKLGLSQRSIAPFLAVSHQTVKNDCARLGLSGRVIGANGKSYSPLPKWHLQTPSGHSATLGERRPSVLFSRDAA